MLAGSKEFPKKTLYSMLRERLERIDCAKRLLISGEPGVHSTHCESPVHWPGMVSVCGIFFSAQKATGILGLCFSPHLSEANLQTKSSFSLATLGGRGESSSNCPHLNLKA